MLPCRISGRLKLKQFTPILTMQMIRLALTIALFASAAVAQPVSSGQFIRADKLYDACKTESPNCIGYVAGVADFYAMIAAQAPAVFNYCPPHEGSPRQISLIYLRFVEKNPKDMTKSASSVLMAALDDAFPCKR